MDMEEYLRRSFEEYKNNVNRLIDEDSHKIFGNYSQRHAGFITQRFVSLAQNDVKLLAGSLIEDIYNRSVQQAFADAVERLMPLNRKGAIRILTLDNLEPPDWICELLRKSNETIQFKTYKARVNGYHFLIVDGKRYRLEEPHEPLSGQKPQYNVKAEVCCNGPQKSEILSHFFDKLWSVVRNSTKVDEAGK